MVNYLNSNNAYLLSLSRFLLSFLVLFALFFLMISLKFSASFAFDHLLNNPGKWLLSLAAPSLLIAFRARSSLKKRLSKTDS